MKIKSLPSLFVLFAALMIFGNNALAELRVVTSIAPIHSLVAHVMQGVDEPYLLMPATSSPHTHFLSPSQARALNEADLVVWVSPDLEGQLRQPMQKVAADKQLRIDQIPGLQMLATRSGKDFPLEGKRSSSLSAGQIDKHHNDHDHHNDDDHHKGHSHGAFDPHLWLSIDNAQTIVMALAESLSNLYPEHRTIFQNNAKQSVNELNLLIDTIGGRLQRLQDKGYLVYHDAYQYFENDFGLAPYGVITANPEAPTNAGQLTKVHNAINNGAVQCIFVESHFPQKMVERLQKQTQVQIYQLDPLGVRIHPGKDLYSQLITQMANSFRSCLASSN